MINLLFLVLFLASFFGTRPEQVVAFDRGTGGTPVYSADGLQVCAFNHWTVARFARKDGKWVKSPLPAELRGEKIYNGRHVRNDLWVLSLSRNSALEKDGKETRFILFDFATGKVIRERDEYADIGSHLQMLPGQRRFVSAASSNDRRLIFWDARLMKPVREEDLVAASGLADEDGKNVEPYGLAASSDGKQVAVAIRQGIVCVYDVSAKKFTRFRAAEPGSSRLQSVAFLDEKRVVVKVSRILVEDYIAVFDIKSGKQLYVAHTESLISPPAVSPNGRVLAFCGHDGDVTTRLCLHDSRTGKQLASVVVGQDHAVKAAFSPDGKTIVTAGDGFLKFWSVERLLGAKK